MSAEDGRRSSWAIPARVRSSDDADATPTPIAGVAYLFQCLLIVSLDSGAIECACVADVLHTSSRVQRERRARERAAR